MMSGVVSFPVPLSILVGEPSFSHTMSLMVVSQGDFRSHPSVMLSSGSLNSFWITL